MSKHRRVINKPSILLTKTNNLRRLWFKDLWNRHRVAPTLPQTAVSWSHHHHSRAIRLLYSMLVETIKVIFSSLELGYFLQLCHLRLRRKPHAVLFNLMGRTNFVRETKFLPSLTVEIRWGKVERPVETFVSKCVILLFLFRCSQYVKDLIRNQNVIDRE